MTKRFLNQVMRTTKHAFLLALTLCVAPISALSEENAVNSTSISLSPYEAIYTAYKWGDDVGNASITLTALGNDQYSLNYSSKVSKFFLSDKRSEHSIFFIKDGEVTPSKYYYSRSGTGPDKSLEVTFDTDDNGSIVVDDEARFTYSGEFDNQIYRLDLAQQLAKGETTFSYRFINYRGQQREYGVEVVDSEVVSLPYGDIQALKVKLIRDSKTRETFAWFAPSLNYALVRLQQFKDGDEQGDIRLKKFTTR
mgnify:CR=1 FL=1|jgi:hypothetical protein